MLTGTSLRGRVYGNALREIRLQECTYRKVFTGTDFNRAARFASRFFARPRTRPGGGSGGEGVGGPLTFRAARVARRVADLEERRRDDLREERTARHDRVRVHEDGRRRVARLALHLVAAAGTSLLHDAVDRHLACEHASDSCSANRATDRPLAVFSSVGN